MKTLFSIRSTTIFLLLLLGIGGLAGAVPMLLRPDGSLLGMPTSLLANSPVDDYFWPGIFLLVVMVIWPLLNVYGIATKRSWANMSIIMLGAVTMVWIVYETIVIRTFSPLQPFVFMIGLLLAYGGYQRIEDSKNP